VSHLLCGIGAFLLNVSWFSFGAFMCVMGYFVAFSQVGWWWKWLRYFAVHFYNFSTFMTNQYVGNTYKVNLRVLLFA
jgi:hypothetical protein